MASQSTAIAVADQVEQSVIAQQLSGQTRALVSLLGSELEARRHQRLALTAIFVTHDMVEALLIGDRIAVLNEGRVEQLGTAVDRHIGPARKPSRNRVTAQGSRLGDVHKPERDHRVIRRLRNQPRPERQSGQGVRRRIQRRRRRHRHRQVQ